MKMEEKMQLVLAKVMPFVLRMGKLIVITLAMVFGFFTSELRHKYKPMINEANNVRMLNETSIAINERNELMIIDRSTGMYEVYESKIGNTIFSLYANQMYSQKK